MQSTIERAVELLKDNSVTVQDIQKTTGIKELTITKVKQSTDIYKAVCDLKVSEVMALADMYNDLEIDFINEHHDNDFYKYVVRMGDWFDEAIGNQEDYYESDEGMADDLMVATAIQRLNDITTKDKSIMLSLYFSYVRDEQGTV